ncbi:mechanosensitive ion channel family protein [Robertkochia solimangrovi]|uniref:mechanosensitive ion channel family protein n=1 Tax=Robertkochia solimangrovi TaxID=2213046 RepID=UPI00117FA2E9|nr:mechanosensitive ion channel domain-containing protein [Robertkochia solimangrovi]TRZ45766.1 mechanosensitive ion channel family protein [Robertkochia solimangrovi]
MELEKWTDKILDAIIFYGPKLLLALILWLIGAWLIKKLTRMVSKIMQHRNYEVSLTKFLINLISWTLKALLVLAVLGILGVPTTSFAAVIAAAGLAIGLALQGSLANFAGGVLMMIFKPIKVGDLIEAQGELGTVHEIQIFTTILITPDNKTVIIPNGPLSNGNITNYTKQGNLRIDMVIGVDYGSDLEKTRDVLLQAIASHPKTLKEPVPTVAVSELADSSVNFVVRPWALSADYWDVRFGCIENCKKALDAAGIEIPYPHQVEIHKEA